jgi:cysteine desulfuration protein SufE
MAQSMDEVLAELEEEFDLLGDWESRIQHVIDLGRGLPDFPDEARVASAKVPGCAAQVWVVSQRGSDGRLSFQADSDSPLSKGNIALLLRLYSERTPAEILGFDARDALTRLGLPSALTPQRANGLNSMVQRIRGEAEAAQAA